MEEWRTKVEGLLHTSLQIQEELRNLKTSTKTEIEDTITKIDTGLTEGDNKLKHLQVESDELVAKNIKFSADVQKLEAEQKAELTKARQALEEGRRDIEKAENSLKRLCNVFAVKNDPKKVFNYPPVNFTLANFHEHKDNDDVWYSPCFYSHSCGYKMQLQVYPNGDGTGRGTHVSVKVALMPGEFDDLLCWPFRGIITLHLLNQRRDTSHIVHQVWFTTLENLYVREKPIVDDFEDGAQRVGDGVDTFIAHADLKEKAGFLADAEYLKNNSLSLCVWNVDVFYQHH